MDSVTPYVEPLFVYLARKYAGPSLAILPIVAAITGNVVLFRGSLPPPLWAVVYANAVPIVMTVSLFVVYRKRFERRRFRIDENSVILPSVVRIDGSRLELVAIKSVLWVRGTSGEIGILGWHRQALTEVEIKTRYRQENVVLVWPIGAFGRKNLEALQQTLPSAASHA